MILCEFDLLERRNDTYYFQCRHCDFVDQSPYANCNIYRNCPNAPDVTEAAERLGITGDDIKHWAQALARWKRAGYPVRPQAEVEHIERDICRPCEQYVPDNSAWAGTLVKWITGTASYGRCRVCRCGVSSSRVAVANKLAMATEACPEGKWEATA